MTSTLDMSPLERSVLQEFAFTYADTGVWPMRVDEITSRSGLGMEQVFSAIDSLERRGWLFCTSSIRSSGNEECIPLEEGLRWAKAWAKENALAELRALQARLDDLA